MIDSLSRCLSASSSSLDHHLHQSSVIVRRHRRLQQKPQELPAKNNGLHLKLSRSKMATSSRMTFSVRTHLVFVILCAVFSWTLLATNSMVSSSFYGYFMYHGYFWCPAN